MKEKGFKRADKKPIERSQQLPPHFPPSDITRNHMRAKSNLSNLMPSKFTSKRGSKLRISLQGLMESQDKLRLLTPSPFFNETKNSTLMTDKPRHVVIGKRVASKHSRTNSKNKLVLYDKHDITVPKKSVKKTLSSSVSRGSKITKKHKESQKKYITNAELFNSAELR